MPTRGPRNLTPPTRTSRPGSSFSATAKPMVFLRLRRQCPPTFTRKLIKLLEQLDLRARSGLAPVQPRRLKEPNLCLDLEPPDPAQVAGEVVSRRSTPLPNPRTLMPQTGSRSEDKPPLFHASQAQGQSSR